MYNKGNVLQYKKNSSNLTKKQRYSQIAKGMWTNRTKTWASQTETISSPNTQWLQRVNNSYTNVSTEIIDQNSVTGVVNTNCILSVQPLPIVIFPLPDVPTSEPAANPVIPLAPPSGTGSNLVLPPSPPNQEPVVQYVVPDGGNLVCNTVADPCTGTILNKTYNQTCYPSTDSDVPGPELLLCWNDTFPTYYPRTRYTYGNGNNKFPVNAILFPISNKKLF